MMQSSMESLHGRLEGAEGEVQQPRLDQGVQARRVERQCFLIRLCTHTVIISQQSCPLVLWAWTGDHRGFACLRIMCMMKMIRRVNELDVEICACSAKGAQVLSPGLSSSSCWDCKRHTPQI